MHWAGPLDQAEDVLKPFREVAPIVADGTGVLPYPALNGAFDALYPKGLKRSSFSLALVVTNFPSAVTTSAEIRLSIVSPSPRARLCGGRPCAGGPLR